MKTQNKSLRLFAFLALIIFSFTYTNVSYAKDTVLTDEKSAWLNAHAPEIYFAPEKDFPPLIWSQYGELFGLSKDYFDVIQQLIDTRFKTLEPRKLDEILHAVKNNGEKSIISSRAPTPERQEYLLFTRPYFSSPSIFISSTGKKLTGSQIEQKQLKVAVGNNFGVHEYLKERYPKMNIIPFDNDYQVITSVIDKRADIGAINAASLIYLIKENDFSGIKKVGDTGFISNFSFAVPKDMPELRNILDDAIEAIPHDFQKSVLEKWGIDSDEIKAIVSDDSKIIDNGYADKKYVTILVIIVGLLVLIIEYLIHKYVFKKSKN